ncbi:uncharacterized protein LOC126902508 isoform X2 [Daktulosphaira vitifoliae]|uniref:uncharacterized protein LOC126902508 isoform X2 n=1 Tax=Daktulosphaira vitifoliae TaxID=58002 RepID=UPI0021AAD1C9|nr:uncharacterized protein LOC126902508 isoform X2 [Daktulosphaira vitifoliae]
MNIKLLTLIFLSVSIFLEVKVVDCRKEINEYAAYLKQVMNHMCYNLSHFKLEYLSLRNEKNDIVRINDILNQKVSNVDKLIITYYYIVDLINYLFIEVLQLFTEHLKIIIDVCEKLYENNLFENATYCTIVLLNTAKNSNLMFDYLYKAITFIDYLDINSVCVKSIVRSKTVVNEIYTVKNYTSSMKSTEMLNYINNDKSINILVAKEDYKEIYNFVNKVVDTTDNFFKNNFNVINNTIKINLQENYFNEYKTTRCKINFVNFISEKLNVYCLTTIDKYYFNIGFHQFINPNITGLTPPQNIEFLQDKAIEVLNTLFREGNWKLLDHISIINYDDIITTNRIIRDPVNNSNFNIKKKYFTHLLRCRYTEVLKNYNTYISAIIQTCRNQINSNNIDGIKDCTIRFIDAVKDSKNMFKYMLSALNKLKAVFIWDSNYKSNSSLITIYDILSKFFHKIENFLNLTPSDFLNVSNDDIKLKANVFFFDFQRERKLFNQMITTGNEYMKQYCSIKGGVIDKNQLLKSWNEIVMSSNTGSLMIDVV